MVVAGALLLSGLTTEPARAAPFTSLADISRKGKAGAGSSLRPWQPTWWEVSRPRAADAAPGTAPVPCGGLPQATHGRAGRNWARRGAVWPRVGWAAATAGQTSPIRTRIPISAPLPVSAPLPPSRPPPPASTRADYGFVDRNKDGRISLLELEAMDEKVGWEEGEGRGEGGGSCVQWTAVCDTVEILCLPVPGSFLGDRGPKTIKSGD
jgi:hypothetical protein